MLATRMEIEIENLRQNNSPQNRSEIQTHKVRGLCTDVHIVPLQDIANMWTFSFVLEPLPIKYLKISVIKTTSRLAELTNLYTSGCVKKEINITQSVCHLFMWIFSAAVTCTVNIPL